MIWKSSPKPLSMMNTTTQLQAKIQQSRATITQEYSSLKNQIQFFGPLQQAVRKKPWSWMSGFFALGFALPSLFKKSSSSPTFLAPEKLVKKKQCFSSLSQLASLAIALLDNPRAHSLLFMAAEFLLPPLKKSFKKRSQEHQGA